MAVLMKQQFSVVGKTTNYWFNTATLKGTRADVRKTCDHWTTEMGLLMGVEDLSSLEVCKRIWLD